MDKMLGCVAQVVSVSDIPTKLCFYLWIFLGMISIFLASYFIVNKISDLTECELRVWLTDKQQRDEENNQTSNVRKKEIPQRRKQFNILMIITVFLFGLISVPNAFVCLFAAHLYYPVATVDYATLCNNGYFYLLTDRYALFCFAIFDLCYVLVLAVYFFRLVLVLHGSMFEMETFNKYISYVSWVIMVVLCVIKYIAFYYYNYGLTWVCWLFFTVIFMFQSIYLLRLFRKKLLGVARLGVGNHAAGGCQSTGTTIAIFGVVRRCTILAYCGFCTTMLVIVYLFADVVVDIKGHNNIINQRILLIYSTLLVVDNCINILCISLQFEYKLNKFMYNSICLKIEQKLNVTQQVNNQMNLQSELQSDTRSPTISVSQL